MRLGIAWQIGTGFGWGLLGTQLALAAARRGVAATLFEDPAPLRLDPLEARLLAPALGRRAQVRQLLAKNPSGPLRTPMAVVHARGNDGAPAFGRTSLRLRGEANHAIIFFEDTRFGERARSELKSFDTVIAGSSWNAGLLRDMGVGNVRTCLQGIDPAVFHPAPRRGLFGDRFVVFSGGKLEYRKAQDAVVAAFKAFRDRHPDALLVAAWSNPFSRSQGVRQLASHGVLRSQPELDGEGRLEIGKWLVACGLPPDSFILVPETPNKDMATIVREADVALFPNRCEGGTNLVAMEAIACGVPTILSANTGHLDLLAMADLPALTRQTPVMRPDDAETLGMEGWGEPSIDEMVESLEAVYQARDAARARASVAAEAMLALGWDRQAAAMLTAIGVVAPESAPTAPKQAVASPVPAAPEGTATPETPRTVARIYVATPCYGGLVTQECLTSLLSAARALEPKGIRLDVFTRGNDALVTRARNALVADFLSKPEYTHLLFLDADLQFDPEAVERLVAFGADIAGGIYPLKRIDWEAVRRKALEGVADLETASLGYVVELDATRRVAVDRGFCKVKSIGNGFMLIRRGVFQRLIDAYPALKCRVTHGAGAADRLDDHHYAFFDTEIDPETREFMPEDWTFCQRCRRIGVEIWADLASRLVHVGQFRFRGDFTTQFSADG